MSRYRLACLYLGVVVVLEEMRIFLYVNLVVGFSQRQMAAPRLCCRIEADPILDCDEGVVKLLKLECTLDSCRFPLLLIMVLAGHGWKLIYRLVHI
jgi:hypothetical protein